MQDRTCLFCRSDRTVGVLLLRDGTSTAGRMCSRCALRLRARATDDSCVECSGPADWELELHRRKRRPGDGPPSEPVLCDECLTDRIETTRVGPGQA